jgi:2'-5' RNA ligase
MRTFLAVTLPPEVTRNIGTIQGRLKKSLSGDIRWVRPEGIHLTLKFFGEVTAADAERIGAVVAGPAAGAAPFVLDVRGLGAFPDVNRPRVIWLGLAGETVALLSLHRELERELAAAGFPKEERPFSAHLTLGRVKIPKGILGLAGEVETGADVAAGRIPVGEIVLFKSELTPRGAIYTRLAAFPLRG